MRCIHFCAGLEPWNGMANTARQFVAEELALGGDSSLTNRIGEVADWLADARCPKRVHIHGTWRPELWRVAKMAKASGAELVIRPAGNYDPLRLRRGLRSRIRKLLAGPFERAMLRRADVIQATCEAEADWIRRYLGASGAAVRGRIEITDLRRFFRLDAAPVVRHRDDDRLHVLFLGRAEDPLKGVRYLERAIALTSVRDRIALHTVSGASGEALEREWEWADVLCLPTLSENFGRVVAEALERGKFAITTDGAPAWDDADSGPDGARWRARLVYLRGFRDGDDALRAELLRRALEARIGV